MKVCDNCKRDPEPFQTDRGETGYFFIILKGQDEPIALMSSMEYMFQICLDRNPELREGEQAICNQCLLAMYLEESEDE